MKKFRLTLAYYLILILFANPLMQAQNLNTLPPECSCQQAMQNSPPIDPKTINQWMQDTLHIMTTQGKPTGLPQALSQAIQQETSPRAIQIGLQTFYRVPWPGRIQLVQQLKNRFAVHPCVQWLETLL